MELQTLIKDNFEPPKKSLYKRIKKNGDQRLQFRFIIDAKSKLSRLEIIKGVSPEINAEIERLTSRSNLKGTAPRRETLVPRYPLPQATRSHQRQPLPRRACPGPPPKRPPLRTVILI